MSEVVTETRTYCANHPQVETALRCNRCGKPICTKCIVRTPVGYRCRECVRSQQQIFETGRWYDYLIAAVLSLPLGAVSALILGNFGFFMLLLAPVAGGLSAEIVRAAVRRRRGRYLTLTATIAFALGSLAPMVPVLFAGLLLLLGGETGGLGRLLFSAIWPLIFTALATSTLYARLRGISV